MGSVKELAAKQAGERKELMQTVFKRLKESGVNAALADELTTDCYGTAVYDSVIHLKGQSADRIRLLWSDSASCHVTGNILRFQWEVLLGKDIPADAVPKINAETRTIKEGKTLGVFGGKVTGMKWVGGDLAKVLNEDTEIAQALLHCARSLGNMVFQVTAGSGNEVYIQGPGFTEARWMTQLYASGQKEEAHECVFGFKIGDRIAKYVRATAASW